MSSTELGIRQRRGTVALAGRETRRVLSLWTQTILPPVLTATLFLAVFGGALGGPSTTSKGSPYLSFILPGLLVMTVAAQSFANCATSVFQAKNEGYIEDVLTSPLQPRQVAISYVSGGLLRGLLAAVIVRGSRSPGRPRRRTTSARANSDRPRVREPRRDHRNLGRDHGRH